MRTARILMTLAIAMFLTAPLMAQQKPQKKRAVARLSAPSRVLARLSKLHKTMESLDLSDEQKEAFKKMHEEVGPKMKEALEKVSELLTEEQKTAAKEAAKKAKEAGKEGWALFRSIESAVKLTDAQKEKMEEVGKEMTKLQQTIMKKVTGLLTDEQKQTLRKKMAPRRGKAGGQRGKKKDA